jgi:hypothetical protein
VKSKLLGYAVKSDGTHNPVPVEKRYWRPLRKRHAP